MDNKEYLLAQMRVASLRLKLMDAKLTEIGVSLKLNMIDNEQAAQWLEVDELMFLISVPPGDEDEEIADYVRTLEQARDTADLPEASGEAIAQEFERYLRRRTDERP
jgi:hypothetical protein